MKNFLVICFLFIGLASYGQLDTVDIGTAANDGTGDPLRTAFIKINAAIIKINRNDTVFVTDSIDVDTVNVNHLMYNNPGNNSGKISFESDGLIDIKVYADDDWTGRQTYTQYNENYILNSASDAAGKEKSILINASSMLVTDDQDVRGLTYDLNYGANFTDRSLIDKNYVDSLTDPLLDTVSLETIVQLLSDSAVVIPFLMGSGQAGDTALFNDGAICGSFYNYKDTLIAVYFNGVMSAGTGTETMTIDIKWHATFQDGSAVELNSTPLTVTSLTTGTTDASFNNSIIPPGVRVWGIVAGIDSGNRPSYFEGSLVCYRQNRRY